VIVQVARSVLQYSSYLSFSSFQHSNLIFHHSSPYWTKVQYTSVLDSCMVKSNLFSQGGVVICLRFEQFQGSHYFFW